MTEMGADAGPVVVDSGGLFAACSPAQAVAAIEEAMRGGLEPATTPRRQTVAVEHGQLLLMPGQDTWTGSSGLGIKIVTVAPDNPSRGLPRVQACYLLYDPQTLTLRAILDGTALTALRTPAVSVAAVRSRLPRRAGGLRVVAVGAGHQARAHVRTLRATVPGEPPLASVHHLVRDPAKALADLTGDDQAIALRIGTADAEEVLRLADVVVCATSAREPLFPSTALRDDVVVIAVGAYEPDAREVDAALCRRAAVVVEDRTTALREAGDIVLAVAEGALFPTDLIAMRDVVTGRVNLPADRPALFKSVGMAWQDLVVAQAVLRGLGA